VVNPNQAGCDYPCKTLCGAGIAFKLAQALMEKRLLHRDQTQLLLSFLKVAAIATIADSVPLVEENRVIASLGLNALRTAVNPGLKALLDVAQLGGKPLSSGEVAFRIAPRINAAGRMDIAGDVIDLFACKESAAAQEIAGRLDKLNTERQEEERSIVDAIEHRISEDPALRDAYCMVIDGEGWHRGVIGITATRVVERYGRPALVISRDGDDAHGSGRSIAGFHLLNALESCSDLFTRFGGHAHAVGFSLPCARISELQSRLHDFARTRLTPADFEPLLNLDAEFGLETVTPALFETIAQLQPFGAGNPEPGFIARKVRLTAPPSVMGEKHVRLKLVSGSPASSLPAWRRSVTHKALGWRLAERVAEEKLLAGDFLDIAFSLDRNEHPDFGGIELSLKDFRRSVQATSAESSG
jgi:single-stranded-DNA-specific exonuclease